MHWLTGTPNRFLNFIWNIIITVTPGGINSPDGEQILLQFEVNRPAGDGETMFE